MTRHRIASALRLLTLVAVPAGLVAAVAAVPAPLAAQPTAAEPVAVEAVVRSAESDRVAVIEKVSPAVVAVCMVGGRGVGSGVLIDPEGYALTNHHVVQPTGPVMQCGLADGVLYDAVLVGMDMLGDVALIKLLPKEPGKPFPFVRLGNSDEVRVGEAAFAAGNPFSVALDFTPTVTYGIVSGTNRYEPLGSRPGGQEYTDCIQVDVPINPGNSGGPLFNMRGELIGINGRISLEKRGRVNVGVGYAISINQIKNFLGHLYAGLAADHATLGALVLTENEDADLARMVVRQILDDSDAARRGLRTGDQLVTFAGRNMSSTNHYKNILGTFPGGWRVPLTYRRERETHEVLVRLQGVVETPKEERPPPGGPPPAPKIEIPTPKVETPASKLYRPVKGLANGYFNDLARDKLLAAAKKHGDFAAAAGPWVAEGTYDAGERKGEMRFEVAPGASDDTRVSLKLNIEHKLLPLRQTDAREQAEPIGSGGLMMALYHYHRFLTTGRKGFEGEFLHGGGEPFYPPPAGAAPKSLAEQRVDAELIRTRHGPVTCKWYFGKADGRLLGFEVYLTKNGEPCEVYLSDYRDVGAGRTLPHRIECRFADKRYATLTVTRYALGGN
jgi:S1-C subfamily serine protease